MSINKYNLCTIYETDRDFIFKLLKYGINIPFLCRDTNNNTILHKMIMNNDFNNIDLLLKNIKEKLYNNDTINILLNGQNKQKNTPMHLAIMENLQDVATKIANSGADLSIPNQDDFIIKQSDDNYTSSITSDMPKILYNNDNDNVITSDNDMSNILNKLVKEKNPKKMNIPSKDDLFTSETDYNSSEMNKILEKLLVENKMKYSKNRDNEDDSEIKIKGAIGAMGAIFDANISNNKTRDYNENLIIKNKLKDYNKKVDIYRENENEYNDFSATSPLETKTSSSTEFFNFLKQKMGQLGGANSIKGVREINDLDSINSNESDTLGIYNLLNQDGGKKKSRKSMRSYRRSSRHSSNNSSRKSSRLSSRSNKPSTVIHDEVVELIKKMGYSEDDARYIKAGLYQIVKEKFANLSNMQRANKLKELTNEDEVKKIAKLLPKLKEAVEKARELRKKENEKLNTKEVDKSKEKKKRTKREGKERKKI